MTPKPMKAGRFLAPCVHHVSGALDWSYKETDCFLFPSFFFSGGGPG